MPAYALNNHEGIHGHNPINSPLRAPYRRYTMDNYGNEIAAQIRAQERVERAARSLVARESPSSDDEHFERLVSRLLEKHYETGDYLERCWLML